MAVRDRAFHRFAGEPTARRWRFLVLWRFGRQEVFASKLVTSLFALAFAPVLGALIFVYARHNLTLLAAMNIPLNEVLPVDADFFLLMLRVQGAFAFLLTALVGPGLIAPDLANNGLPLYLCRPFSRAEYVLGKLSVLGFLTSAVTWVPLLVLFVLQASLESGWLAGHWAIAGALFVGALTWVVFLALLALALSAWVRWRLLAAALLVALVLVAGGFAEFVNQLFHTEWGDLLSPGKLILAVWQALFKGSDSTFLRVPLWSAWMAIGVACALCLLILNRKLRAYEVVR